MCWFPRESLPLLLDRPPLHGTSPWTAAVNSPAKRGPGFTPSGPPSAVNSDSTTVQSSGVIFLPEWWKEGCFTTAAGETTAGSEPTIPSTLQMRRLGPKKSRTCPRLRMELKAEPRCLAGQPRTQRDKMTRCGLCLVAAAFLKRHLL